MIEDIELYLVMNFLNEKYWKISSSQIIDCQYLHPLLIFLLFYLMNYHTHFHSEMDFPSHITSIMPPFDDIFHLMGAILELLLFGCFYRPIIHLVPDMLAILVVNVQQFLILQVQACKLMRVTILLKSQHILKFLN